ncbi:MAG: sigma-70 family RNA polymerase sigma factor [Phycisphaerales bacterium]|nr:MAG: sigma-70 family RNA polymerase sigma factor [Phycisphaerales bacterium]
MSSGTSSDCRQPWYPALYEQLRQTARKLVRRERTKGLLQPTALLHEAYVKLARQRNFLTRTHFFAAAVGEMRRVLVDHARREQAVKRGGRHGRLLLDTRVLAFSRPTVDLTELHDALESLAALSSRQARVVELRFLAGLSEEETAAELGVSRRTVQQDWRGARAWLRRELSGEQPTPQPRVLDSRNDAPRSAAAP